MANAKHALEPNRTAPPGAAWRLTGVVALVALVPRIWHLLEFSRLPWFRVLQMDAKYHAEWARRLVDGHWSDPQVFFRAPAYPYFLAALQSITGEILVTARIVQIVLGVATVVLTHRVALRILPGRWSTVAGLLAALAWVPIHYETELLLEPLVTFLVTLSLFLAVRAERTPGTIGLLCWGGLVGLATVTRPNAIVLLPLLPAYAAALGLPRLGRGDGARRDTGHAVGAQGDTERAAGVPWRWISRAWVQALPRPAVLILAGFLVPIAPIWIHNARQGDPATVLAWQGGINLYLGNNPAANGWAAIAPGMRADWQGGFDDAVRIANEQGGGPGLKPSAISSYWTREAARFWTQHPGRALGLTMTKVLLFWGGAEIKNNEDPAFVHATMWSLRWLPVSFATLAPFALVGIVLAFRAGARWRLLAGFTVTWFLSIVPFFVCARYRLPVTPILPLFALLALVHGLEWWRARRWNFLAPSLLAIAILFPLLLAPRAGAESGGAFQAYNNLGDAYAELGDWNRAIGAYRRSLELDPKWPASWNNLGLAYERSGRPDDAEQAYRDGIKAQPDQPTLRRNLGKLLLARGKHAEAAEIFRAVREDFPGTPDDGLFLVRSLIPLGRRDEGVEVCRDLLSRNPGNVQLRIGMVALLRESGRNGEADAAIADGLRLAPGNADLRRLTGAVSSPTGTPPAAAPAAAPPVTAPAAGTTPPGNRR